MYYFDAERHRILFTAVAAKEYLRSQNADIGLAGLLPVLEREPQLLQDQDIMKLALADQLLAFSLRRLVADMVANGHAAVLREEGEIFIPLNQIEVRKVENPNGDFRYFCGPGKQLVFKILDEYS